MIEGETKTVSDGWTGLVAGPARGDRVEDMAGSGRFGLEVDDDALPRSTQIGRFVLDRRLGAGGMGIVYAAFDPELDREVAIKLVRARLDDRHARAQTLGEAKALARLSHPNVVQIYEVGEHDGLVFLAMEYVHGVTLRSWMGEKPRSWSEVIATFLQCGAGLHAAHQAGLVHRDFKPENVMVGYDGRVRVLDFGIARAGGGLGEETAKAPEQGRETSSNGRHRFVGTPAYMSPEQHGGGPPDTRSDQFGFCVALWEALYGDRPYVGSSRAELGRAVIAGERREPPTSAAVPAWVRRVLERGLAVDSDARWPSMAELLRALDGESRRTARRIAIAVALVLISVIVVAALARRSPEVAPSVCAGGREQLAEIWDPARAQALRESFSADGGYRVDTWAWLERFFDDYADAWVEGYADACNAHQRGEESGAMLDLRMSCLGRRRAELAALIDALDGASPEVLTNATHGARTLAPLRRCSEREALTANFSPPARDDAAQIEALRDRLARAVAAAATGQIASGRTLAAEAAAEAERIGYRPVLAEALVLLGRLQEQLGEAGPAAESLRRAYWSAEAAGHHAVKAEAAALLVIVIGVRLARGEEIETWRALAEALIERTGGGELEATLAASLATLARHQGDLVAARKLYERALELQVEVHSRSHPTAVSVRSNLAALLSESGHRREALAHFEEALGALERTVGPRHPLVGHVLVNIGSTHFMLGDLELAAQAEERALGLYAEIDLQTPAVAAASNNLSNVHLARGDLAMARDELEVSLSIREGSLAIDHPELALVLNNIAVIDLEARALDRAERYFTSALWILEQRRGRDAPQLFYPLTGLGRLELLRGRPYTAMTLLERAVAVADTSLHDSARAEADFALAQALVGSGREHRRALQLARRARGLYEGGDPHRVDRREAIDAWLSEAQAGLATMRERDGDDARGPDPR